MEPAIKSKEALETIANVVSKPWYKKIEVWLTVFNIIALIINIAISIKIYFT